jgi:hypothetical protein
MISFRTSDLLTSLEQHAPSNFVGMEVVSIFPRETGVNKIVKQDGRKITVQGWHNGVLNLDSYRTWVRDGKLFIRHRESSEGLDVVLDGNGHGPVKAIHNGIVETADGTKIYPEKVVMSEMTVEAVFLTTKK